MIKRLVWVGILFDFYGKLLSERQYIAIELYYIHDLSLSEIGEELNISRQGVYDALKRAEYKLYEYEEVLGLVKRFNRSKEKIELIYNLAKEIEEDAKAMGNEKMSMKAKKLKVILEEVRNDSQEVVC